MEKKNQVNLGYFDMLTRLKKALAILLNLEQPEYQILTGSRRVIKQAKPKDAGFYGNDSFRYEASSQVGPFLRKNESIYYEIVGYAGNETPLMPSVDNKVVGKDFVKKFGKTTNWTYGCIPGQFDIYVYNWMISGDDGHNYSYPWEYIAYQCNKYGLKTVPHLATYKLGEFDSDTQVTRETLAKLVAELTEDQFSTIDNHLREGVCLRVEKDGMLLGIYKNKSRSFYILEGVIKSEDSYVDTEELESYQ